MFYFLIYFPNLKIGYDTVQICAHVCKTLHYIDSKKICCKRQMRNYIQIFSLVQVAYNLFLVIGLVIPTLQHNVNSLWYALIKRHAILFIEIGIH